MKKILALILSLAVMASFCSFFSFAEAAVIDGDIYSEASTNPFENTLWLGNGNDVDKVSVSFTAGKAFSGITFPQLWINNGQLITINVLKDNAIVATASETATGDTGAKTYSFDKTVAAGKVTIEISVASTASGKYMAIPGILTFACDENALTYSENCGHKFAFGLDFTGVALEITEEGEFKLEAENEKINTSSYVKSGGNDTIIVEREDASGGKFLAGATGNVGDDKYFLFRISLAFDAEVTLSAAYAQPEKYKANDMPMWKSYGYIFDGAETLTSEEDKYLAARTDITQWEVFDYGTINLSAGEHVIKVQVLENHGKSNPNIDYMLFNVKKVAELDFMRSLDFVNGELDASANAGGSSLYTREITLAEDYNENITIAGWVACTKDVVKIQYSIDSGAFADAEDNYRSRDEDVVPFCQDQGLAVEAGKNQALGFGNDNQNMVLTGTDNLSAGTHTIELQGVTSAGKTFVFAQIVATVEGEAEPVPTADASLVIFVVAAVAVALVVLKKKVF